jgi:hypothetical protein
MWRLPSEADWQSDAPYLDPADHQPQGFSLPSKADIDTAGFSLDVIRWQDDEHAESYFQTELLPQKTEQGAAANP